MVTVDHRPATLLDCALDALAHGLAVVPPAQDGTKRPDGRWKTYQQRLPTEEEIRSWYSTNDRTGIGVITGAVSGNLEMLELEGRAMEENVGDDFADLAAAAGLTDLVDRINAGYCETTPSGGLHLLYRVQGPVAGNLKLARRPAAPDELEQNPDDPIRVLIETRGEGGYVVIAPSHGTVHPTGNEWVLLNGGFDTIATITPDERDALHEVARALDRVPPTQPPAPPRTTPTILNGGDDERPGDLYNNAPDAAATTLQLLERHGWTRVFHRPHDGHDDIHLRRPGKTIGTSAVLHMDAGTLVVFSTSTPFQTEQGYTPFGVLATLEHGGDHSAAARTLRPASQPRDDLSWARLAGDSAASISSTCATAAPPQLHLPDSFWTARPALEHIRDAARNRMVAPDAVLGACLARVAAITPHMVEIPAVIGSPIGLTFYAGLVGPSSAGKSAAAAVAGELLPAPDHILDRLPIGSGEGMVEILFDLVDDDTSDSKKPKKVKRQTRYAAIFHIDEAAVVSDLASRQGTTLLPTLRTAYSHGTLGNTNASAERKRIVDGKAYVYGITLGIQPELAGPLLADTAAGTPQRIVWVNALDPAAPDQLPAWPGELDWQPPNDHLLNPQRVLRAGTIRYPLNIHPAISDEIITDRRNTIRGTVHHDIADAHQMLTRLKTAALLALLDERIDVTEDDWQLAATITTTSKAIRQMVTNTLHAVEAARERAGLEKHARRELHVETSREAKALTSAARSIANLVHRHQDENEHEDPTGCTKRCCHAALNKRIRDIVTVDDAITEAAHKQWIAAVNGRWVPGESKPA